MKILIVNPPFYRLQNATLVHYPPGPCYVAAALEQAGLDCSIYNADFDPRKKTVLGNTIHMNIKSLTDQEKEYQIRLNNQQDPLWEEIHNRIVEIAPDILVLSVFNTTLTAANNIARRVKQSNPNLKTVYEGAFNRGLHCAVDPSKIGDWEIMDFAIRGEPEITIVELISALTNQDIQMEKILGLSWKNKDGQIINNSLRPYNQDLDQIPYPAFHKMLDFQKMPPHSFLSIYGSRGCPYQCVFCACQTNMGDKMRLRSAQNMVDEIESVYRKYGTRYYYLCDDIFFFNKTRAKEFCHLLLKRKLPIYWSAQNKAEIGDDEIFALAKEAGCQHIAVGVEVGSPKIRQLIKKGNTVDDVRKCAKLVKKNGLYFVAFCMIGLPWETEADIQMTVDLIKEIKPYITFPYMPTPAAGTELAKIMEQKNPEGIKQFRDKCHLDPSAILSENIEQSDKKQIVELAFREFEKINREQFIRTLWKRVPFYWALSQDMRLFQKPGLLFSFFKDIFFK